MAIFWGYGKERSRAAENEEKIIFLVERGRSLPQKFEERWGQQTTDLHLFILISVAPFFITPSLPHPTLFRHPHLCTRFSDRFFLPNPTQPDTFYHPHLSSFSLLYLPIALQDQLVPLARYSANPSHFALTHYWVRLRAHPDFSPPLIPLCSASYFPHPISTPISSSYPSLCTPMFPHSATFLSSPRSPFPSSLPVSHSSRVS